MPAEAPVQDAFHTAFFQPVPTPTPSMASPLPSSSQHPQTQPERLKRHAPPDASQSASKRPCSNPSSPTVASNSNNSIIKAWIDQINSQIASSGGLDALSPFIERPRYRMLRDACARGDVFYIILHQFFCRWSAGAPLVHNMPVDSVTISSVCQSLLLLLRRNDDMTRGHLAWFAAFPSPQLQYAEGAQEHSQAYLKVITFFHKFSAGWDLLLRLISNRGYPLTAHEATYALACHSPILSNILFTFTRRTLSIKDGPVAVELVKCFSEDQAQEVQLAERDAPPDVRQRARENVYRRYLTLVSQFRLQDAEPAAPLTPSTQHHSPVNQVISLNHMAEHNGQAQLAQVPPCTVRQGEPPPAARGMYFSASQHPAAVHATSLPAYNHQLTTPTASSPTNNYFHGIPAGPQAQQQQFMPLARVSPGHPHVPAHTYWHQSPPHMYSTLHGNLPASPTTGQAATFMPPRVPLPSNSSPVQTRAGAHSPNGHMAAAARSNMPNMPNMPSPAQRRGPASAPAIREPLPPLRSNGPVRNGGAAHRQPPRIPENEYPASPYDWTSLQAGLHLIRLRSPGRSPLLGTPGRFYQFFDEFAVEPMLIEPSWSVKHLKFDVPKSLLARLSVTQDSKETELPVAYFSNGSIRYLLRSCSWKKPHPITQGEWAVQPSSWPESFFVIFNQKPQALRKKQQWHVDLPIELTNSVRLGDNIVQVQLPIKTGNKKLWLAVEVVKIIDHHTAVSSVMNATHVSVEETKREIGRRLQRSDSDDIIVEDDHLTVSLADPFTSLMYEIPVRGLGCKHLECFDLETWLRTRPSKPPPEVGDRKDREPCKIDSWKCPICGLDARPPSLRVDDYFAEMRATLLSRGQGRVKQVQVDSGGNWTPAGESEDSGDETSSVEDEDEASNRLPPRPSKRPAAVVIEILDDDDDD
jgi:hypothetical protein